MMMTLALVLTMALSTQARPDFSGQWTTALEAPAAGAGGQGRGPGGAPGRGRGDMGSGWGPTIRITQTAQQITDGPFDVLAHDVSPDGQRVAYVRTREGRFAHATDLWVCTVQGQEPVRLTESHAHVLQPAWSPTGRYIAFTGAVLAGDAEVRLWLHDTTTRQTRQLGDVEVADPASVHWPDGDEAVVFVRAHAGADSRRRADGAGVVQARLLRRVPAGKPIGR